MTAAWCDACGTLWSRSGKQSKIENKTKTASIYCVCAVNTMQQSWHDAKARPDDRHAPAKSAFDHMMHELNDSDRQMSMHLHALLHEKQHEVTITVARVRVFWHRSEDEYGSPRATSAYSRSSPAALAESKATSSSAR